MRNTRSREQKDRSKRYNRMFSALFFGTVFLIAGLIGFDLSKRNSFFAETRWADGAIPSQVAIGLGLVALGIYWSRRLDDPRIRLTARRTPSIRGVGSGRSKGAALADRRRLDGGGG
jgi:hypothetical protein